MCDLDEAVACYFFAFAGFLPIEAITAETLLAALRSEEPSGSGRRRAAVLNGFALAAAAVGGAALGAVAGHVHARLALQANHCLQEAILAPRDGPVKPQNGDGIGTGGSGVNNGGLAKDGKLWPDGVPLSTEALLCVLQLTEGIYHAMAGDIEAWRDCVGGAIETFAEAFTGSEGSGMHAVLLPAMQHACMASSWGLLGQRSRGGSGGSSGSGADHGGSVQPSPAPSPHSSRPSTPASTAGVPPALSKSHHRGGSGDGVVMDGISVLGAGGSLLPHASPGMCLSQTWLADGPAFEATTLGAGGRGELADIVRVLNWLLHKHPPGFTGLQASASARRRGVVPGAANGNAVTPAGTGRISGPGSRG
ncbi:unnamed protein product, partial [Phaeothamnion confervicola]